MNLRGDGSFIMNYKVIIFDADQTLFDFKKSEEHTLQKTMLEFNIDYDKEYHLPQYKIINSAIWKELEQGFISQKELKIERFKRYIKKLNLNLDEVEFAKNYNKNLSKASFLYENSMDIIKKLKKDYTLTIITNGLKDVQDGRIKGSDIASYFEDIVISEEVQVAKPNPQIFEIALKNINYRDKSKVLIVGDSLTSDIQGGINFGIDTCWLNPEGKDNKGIIPTYEIKDLRELMTII